MELQLNHPVHVPDVLEAWHDDDQDQARIIIGISKQTPEQIILQSLPDADGWACVVAKDSGLAARVQGDPLFNL